MALGSKIDAMDQLSVYFNRLQSISYFGWLTIFASEGKGYVFCVSATELPKTYL